MAHATLKRADIRRACADAGIAVSGLHWLLAAPAGLSSRPPTARSGRRASMSCAARSSSAPSWAVPIWCTDRRHSAVLRACRCCPGGGGLDGRGRGGAEGGRGPIAWSRSATPDCNFASIRWPKAAAIVRRIGNPALRTMVDTLACSLMEKEPVADAIRRWMPTGLMAHIPGSTTATSAGRGRAATGSPPVVEALCKTGYSAGSPWSLSSMSPMAPTCAARMIGYVAGLLEQSP